MNDLPGTITELNQPMSFEYNAPQEEKFSELKFDPTEYTPEQLDGLAAASAVYISVFSKPPFSETWTIKEGVSDLKQRLGLEQFNTENSDHLFSLTKYLVENIDKVQISESGDKQLVTLDNNVQIETVYSIDNILTTYGREIKDPSSLLLLKYEDETGTEKTIDLTIDKVEGQIIKPTGIVRVRNVETSVGSHIEEEIGHYISEESMQELKNILMETRTAYLGEVGNIGTDQRLMLTAIPKIFAKFQPLPKQVVLFTKVGSSILQEEGKNNDIMLRILNKFVYKGQELQHVQKQYPDATNSGIVVNIYQVVNGNGTN